MVGSKAVGFSLLSRGVGQKEGEKVEVKLESTDYYNWIHDPSRIFLPPIHVSQLNTPRRAEAAILKKTFTTRKGALLLFSEDFALKEDDGKGKLADHLSEAEPLKVEDFAKCILSYGDRKSTDVGTDHVYLKFVHHRKDRLRAVRPGFSAKRYIASWSQHVDNSFLDKLTTTGALHNTTLYESNIFLPHLKHRIGADLSHYPAPYRIMREMLLSPGEMTGYTFVWANRTSREPSGEESTEMQPYGRSPSLSQGSIKVMRQDTKGVMHEVEYSDLDQDTKETVLTELLLKSAISHALQKTEEAMDKALSGVTDGPGNIIQELADAFSSSSRQEDALTPTVDQAPNSQVVEIPCQAQTEGIYVVTSRRPSHEERGSTSKHDSPSRQSKKSSSSPVKGSDSPTTVKTHQSTKSDESRKGNESPSKLSTSSKHSGMSAPRAIVKPHLDLGGVPKAEEPRAPSVQSGSGSTPSKPRSTPSKTPVKRVTPGSPGLTMPSPKINNMRPMFGFGDLTEEDELREASDVVPRGPIHGKTTGTKKMTSSKEAPSLSRENSGGMGLVRFDMKEAVETMLSEPPKPDEGVIKAAQQARQASTTTEIAMADMGEKVRAPFARKISGGALTSGGTVQGNVKDMKAQEPGSLFPTLDEQPAKSEYKPKLQKRASDKLPPIDENISDPSTWKNLTKEQLIEQLRKHAAEIAARVMRGGGGKDLAGDARLAADIWTDNYTERSKSFIEELEQSENAPSEDESQNTLQAQMLGQLLANFKNFEDIAEFKDVLLQTLGNIMSSLTGTNIIIPADAEISEELLRALANQELDPDDIEIYVDHITGKTYVRLRKKGQKPTPMVERTLGDVVIPAGVDIDDELAAMLAMGQYTADDIEFYFDEKTGRRVARLKEGAVKKPPKIGGIELPPDAVMSDDILKALASGDLCADDLELVWDKKLGRHVVRIKLAAKNKVRTIGGVIIPKDAVIDDALAAALALGEYDADDLEYVLDEKTGKMTVRLKEGAKKKPKNIGGLEIPADAELDEELLALLESGNINPDDLEIFFDEATGKTIVRLKKKPQARKLGDVGIPADVEIDSELAAMLAMGQYTADDIEFVIDEKTGKRVARLKMGAKKKPPTIGGIKLPDDAYIPDDILAALANSTLNADDLEVVWDEKLGRHVVRIKSAARRRKVRQIGDVFIPRDAEIDAALAAALALGEYTADDLEYIYDEKTGKTIVRLKADAKKKARKIGGIDIPADAEISAELLLALQSDDITADDLELVWDEATGKMVVRLKSSYRRRKENEERQKMGLRPLSSKEKPTFVFGKHKNDDEMGLYGPYDPNKKVQYGIPEVVIKSRPSVSESSVSPPQTVSVSSLAFDATDSAPTAPTVVEIPHELVNAPKVRDGVQKGPIVKPPKKEKLKGAKKESHMAVVRETKAKKPKGKSKEPASKKSKTDEEDAKPRKIKVKVLRHDASGDESSEFERAQSETETGAASSSILFSTHRKRKIKLRTDSGRSYYTEVDEDEYELKTKESIVEIRLNSSRELSVVLKEVEPEKKLEDEFGRPRLLSKAKAERRRAEIERKRMDRELKKKQEKEDLQNQELMEREFEDEMARRMEEARMKREQDELDRNAAIEQEEQREQERLAAVERAKKLREQQKERMEAIRKQREVEERERRELARLREEAEAERLRREMSMLERMSQKDREEYLRKQKEEEEERMRQEEVEKRRQIEETRLKMAEARRLAEEMMRRQKELETRLTFNRGLWAESTGLKQAHDVSRAFVWSYYELLQWLGLDIPSG